MKSIPHVIEVEHLGEHRLRLEFDDGLVRELDFADRAWGPALSELRDPEFFGRVFVDEESGTIAWPNDVDLDPEVLHGDAEPNSGNPARLLAEYRV